MAAVPVSDTSFFICEVIRVHDNPTIDIPISIDMPTPKIYNLAIHKLAVAFREADRLWMITIRGVYVDLDREGKNLQDRELFREQLEANLERYRDERKLYSESDGPFQDEEMFFRTDGGYKLLKSLLREIVGTGIVPQKPWLASLLNNC